ncbi:hypothetical protein GCM10022222_83680 [Amycolatopsis ultiminotia]|uniref:HTH luxR-type domain-containing protein n=1 Tax=Amycolatopsis ultiminotia TaxID=543629 RepID=A0ABP6YLV4_9PSEU
MTRRHPELVGRQVELDTLDTLCRGPQILVAVRGPRGSGRSVVLGQLGRNLRADGITVLDLPFRDVKPAEWDLFGARAILHAIREQFEGLGADPRLAESITAVHRLCTAESYASPSGQYNLLTELSRMFARIAVNGPAVVLADDVDSVPKVVMALAAAHRAGHRVVATCTGDQGEPDEIAHLCSLADRSILLEPLSADEVSVLLRHLANTGVDGTLHAALRRGLGSRYGNPGALDATCTHLRRSGRLAVVQGELCLRDPADPVRLAPSDPLLAEVDAVGADLVALATSEPGFAVDEIPVLAVATGRSAVDCGLALDRLVRTGALESDARGRLGCPCPALGVAVRERLGADAVAKLHRAVAEHLLSDGAHAVAGPAVVADHVVAAGRTLAPRPDAAVLLRAEADRAAPVEPGRAAERLFAARWHGAGGEVRELVRLLCYAGSYRRLDELITELADTGAVPEDEAERRELACAAVFAAVHLGRPVPQTVRAALGDTVVFRFADRWFEGVAVSPAEARAAFRGLSDRWPRRSAAARPVTPGRLASSGAMRDLVTVFSWMFGAWYRIPESGPLAAYHRLTDGFVRASWPAALSAARELEAASAGDCPERDFASLLAAEMALWCGKRGRAIGWLGLASRTRFPALCAWVECGLRQEAGDVEGALSAGWRVCLELTGKPAELGTMRLLVRMAGIAMSADRDGWARQILEEVKRRHAWESSSESWEALLLVRGMVEGELSAVRAAERMVRSRGHLPDLVWACMGVARVAPNPRDWLTEAHQIATELSASRLRAKVKQLMETHGVLAPVARSRGVELSALELDIIDLIRDGRTNRQIAVKMQMSEKTVGNHLTRLFGKVGCRTRHGLAAASLSGRLEPRPGEATASTAHLVDQTMPAGRPAPESVPQRPHPLAERSPEPSPESVSTQPKPGQRAPVSGSAGEPSGAERAVLPPRGDPELRVWSARSAGAG